MPGRALSDTFPNVGAYAYDCLLHSAIPGSSDMDGVIKVIARPQPSIHNWTVRAGTGNAIDALMMASGRNT